jgi:ABC-2 type transport system ATP-binding protein
VQPEVTPGIEIRGLRVAYGSRQALAGITVSVLPARFTALLGPNGAGKSTLVSVLCGLVHPDAGSVEVLGNDLARQPRAALREMGMVFQQQTLDLDLSVAQNMRYFAALRGLAGREARRCIDAALERMGLLQRTRERARDLNGGHRRRLEIARALVHEPRVLILDEPTVGLDVQARSELVEHVHALSGHSRLTVLWATHLVDEIWPDDDVVVLHRGEVALAGSRAAALAGTGAATIGDAYRRLTAEPAEGAQARTGPGQ